MAEGYPENCPHKMAWRFGALGRCRHQSNVVASEHARRWYREAPSRIVVVESSEQGSTPLCDLGKYSPSSTSPHQRGQVLCQDTVSIRRILFPTVAWHKLGKEPILNPGEFQGHGALLVVVRHAVDPGAHGIAPHQPGIAGFRRRKHIPYLEAICCRQHLLG
jgi:hypothetical protein